MTIEYFKKKIPLYKKIIEDKNKNIVVNTLNKKILIYQNGDFHTEISCCIIYHYSHLQIDIYHPHIKSINNCFVYYENIFEKKLNYVDNVNEDMYEYIFVLTSREINLLKPKNKNKYILFKHVNEDIFDNYIDISFNKLVKAKYNIMPIYNLANNNKRYNIISIVGNMSSLIVRDLEGLIKLLNSLSGYYLYIFTRKIDEKFRAIFYNHNMCKIYINLNTQEMISKIQKSKFIITADTPYYQQEGIKTGVLTGMIPLALNNNIPLILSKKLNKIYQLRGVIEYDDIFEISKKIMSLNENEYNKLVDLLIEYKQQIVDKNGKTLNKIIKL